MGVLVCEVKGVGVGMESDCLMGTGCIAGEMKEFCN